MESVGRIGRDGMNGYRYIGRLPARWVEKIVGSATEMKGDDPRSDDVKELIKIWNHKGDPSPILNRY